LDPVPQGKSLVHHLNACSAPPSPAVTARCPR
jgi:hypothetical protein